MTELLWWFERRAEARQLAHQASELKKRFNMRFFMTDEKYIVLGLDRHKRLIRSIASDPGHCVAGGSTPPPCSSSGVCLSVSVGSRATPGILFPVCTRRTTGRKLGLRVLRFVPLTESRRVDKPDFREELAIRYHPDGIRYAIEVADRHAYLPPQRFARIGEVHFTDTVAWYSGDHRLHFHHPQYRHHS